MSKLEKAVDALLEVFVEYAGKDQDAKNLSNAELSQLIKTELSSPQFKEKVGQEDIQAILDKMDKNRDGKVNFKEFSHCVCDLANACYKKKYGKCK